MPRSGAYLTHGAAHFNIAGCGGRFVISDVLTVAVSELAETAESPASNLSVFQKRAGMDIRSGYLFDLATNIDISHRRRGFIVADILIPHISELAEFLSPFAAPPTTRRPPL